MMTVTTFVTIVAMALDASVVPVPVTTGIGGSGRTASAGGGFNGSYLTQRCSDPRASIRLVVLEPSASPYVLQGAPATTPGPPPAVQVPGHSTTLETCRDVMTAAAVAPVDPLSGSDRSAGSGASALPASNVQAALAQRSAERSARGKLEGATFDAPTLPATALPLRAQLQGAGRCWDTSFVADDVQTNTGTQLKAKGP